MSGRLLFLVVLLTCCITNTLCQTLYDLPQCGQSCITSAAVVCPPPSSSNTESICLCANKEFGTGIRDCISQQCVAGTDLNSTYSYVETFCAPTGKTQAVSALNSITGPSGLSTGVKAAIGVGVGVGGLVVLGVAVFLFMRRRKRHGSKCDKAKLDSKNLPDAWED